jgi:hypothetical protein
MLLTKQNPPPVATEPNGMELKLVLSQDNLIKLISLVLTLLVGSGVWAHAQSNLNPESPGQPEPVLSGGP